MLYKLVLVDDEDWILSGIQNGIEWEELGFVVVGAYSNGKDALTAMKKDPPDALLTDIKMPIQDGISMVRDLREAGYQDIQVVFLSGYDDFEYAQSSLRLGAVDYVLKPSDPNQIAEVFSRIRQRLDEQQSQIQERKKALEMAAMSKEVFRKAIFDCIMYGNDSLYHRLMHVYGDALTEKRERPFVVVSAAMKNTVEETKPGNKDAGHIKYLKKQAAELCEQLMDRVYLIENRFSCSMVFAEMSSCEVDECLERLKRDVRKETGNELMLGKSEEYVQFGLVKSAYDESLKRLFILDMPEGAQRLYTNLCNDTVLKAALADRDQQIVLWSLKNWMAQIDKMESQYQMRLIKRLIYSIGIYFINHGMDDETVAKLYELPDDSSYERVKEGIISFVKAEFMKTPAGGGRNANLCREVAKYISNNYSDDITLNELAERFYISPNYLGTLFKKNLGVGVKEYQTNIRLEQADALIASGKFKLYQVAEMVGYPNYEYFRKTYCKYRGKNPSES